MALNSGSHLDRSLRDVSARRLRYALLALSRAFDERFEVLRLGGRVAKWYSSVGNEATTVPCGLALRPGDVLCSLHRDLGAILALYLDPDRAFPDLGFEALGWPREPRPEPELLLRRLACQLLGKAEGFSQGVERSFHYGYLAPEHGILHVGMISHLGSMIPVAAGCAYAVAGRGGVAINFIGEGGTSTGDFHEGLNMAAVWKLPLVLVIENNRFAFSTPTAEQYLAQQLSDRGPGYGIPAFTIDGNNPDLVAETIEAAVERARRGEGPTLIEAMVGRMRGHSEGDDSLKVVPEEELGRYLEEDPVPAYRHRLEAEGWLPESVGELIRARSKELAEAAIDYGLAAAPPQRNVARRPALAAQPLSFPADSPDAADALEQGSGGPGAEVYYVEAISRALNDAMEADPRVVLFGQDIAAFEGAFRVTKGLWARWPDRVRDTPIAESGTLGLAAGYALLGGRPVVEMQFADFVSCGFNQIVNVIAKFYYRWQTPCPVVVRLPAGGGVGAGAFHSQNPEAWFTHVAGLKVVAPATAGDAYGLLRAALADPNPVIFCEHKFLYRRIKGRLPDGPLALGKARVSHHPVSGAEPAVSLIGYGATTWLCEEAAGLLAEQGIASEVVDLRTLVPLDEECVLESVKRTGRAVVVHEAQLTGGFGGEVAARIAEGAFAWLDAPVRRLAYADRPVPYVKDLEKELLPSVEDIVKCVQELVAY